MKARLASCYKRVTGLLVLCCLASLGLTSVPMGLFPSLAQSGEIWVDDDYHAGTPGWNVTHFASLADALAAVTQGGTIHIDEGLYQGAFQVTKPGVRILGESSPTSIVLDGAGTSCTLLVTADDVTLSGLTVTGASVRGVHMAACARTHITGCVIQGNGPIGIEISGGADHVVENNEISENQADGQALGVHVTNGSQNIILRANQIAQHHDTLQQGTGILVEDECSNTEVIGNTIIEGDFGIRVTESSSSVIVSNGVSLCLHSGIHLQDALSSTVQDNRVEQNQGSGIMLVTQSPGAVEGQVTLVEGNTCENNGAAGIYTRGSPHVRLQGNICRENALHGLALESSYITVTANSLVDNGIAGLRIYDSDPYTSSPLVSIVAQGNTLSGNGVYGVHSEMPDTLDATGNWWGSNAPQVGIDLVGQVTYQPHMLLSVSADPDSISIGGTATQIRARIEGGGYSVIDDTKVSLQTSAGTLDRSEPLLTLGGQADALLFSGDSPQMAVVTARAQNALVSTQVEFYDPTLPGAAVELDLEASAELVCAGDDLTYTLDARNSGRLALHGVFVEERLPEGLSPLLGESSPGAVYDETSRTVQWYLDSLAVADTVSLELRVDTPSSLEEADTLVNVARVRATELGVVRAEVEVRVVPCPEGKGVIQGTVWADLDQDGNRDAGEPRLANAWVELWAEPKGGQALATTMTKVDGTYRFDPVPVGPYCMAVIPPPGHVPLEWQQCGQIEQGATLTWDWPAEGGYTTAFPHVR